MAAIDTIPAYGSRTADAPARTLRRLIGWLPFLGASRTAAPATTEAKRPAHEANYLADIGMEIGF